MIKLLDIEGQTSIGVMNTTGMKNDSNLPSLDVLGNVGVQVTIWEFDKFTKSIQIYIDLLRIAL